MMKVLLLLVIATWIPSKSSSYTIRPIACQMVLNLQPPSQSMAQVQVCVHTIETTKTLWEKPPNTLTTLTALISDNYKSSVI